jgi:hypothetical protein
VRGLERDRRREAIEALQHDGDIHARMAAWALHATLAAYSRGTERVGDLGYAGKCVAVLLAETVPVAPMRAVLLPYLAGAREIVVRLPRSAPAFTRLVVDCLRREDPGFAVHIDDASGPDFVASLATRGVDQLIAFGSDEALERISATTPDAITVEGHGHGFGIALVSSHALLDRRNASELARDICAYEQHGCLSPRCVFVHGGDSRSAAEMLHGALESFEHTWPASPPRNDIALALHNWSASIGAVSHAVFRPTPRNGGAPPAHVVAALEETRLVASPGHRRIAVVPFPDVSALQRAIAGHERHITVVASDPDAPFLPLPIRARRAALGAMQTPPLDGWEDPRPATITRR